jgi:asparagine synthase (glutamine-hydrolysing)
VSGILGVWNRDGRPVDEAMCERLAEAMSHRGPDGRAFWIEGSVGLGSLMMRVTPEAATEHQPLVGPSGCVLAWDGRLDNRDGIWGLLQDRGRDLPHGAPDPDLVLAAYEQLGDSFVERLLGDFSLAVFDPRGPNLLLARDAFGVRPLSYWATSSVFVFATEIKSILAHPDVHTSPDEDLIAELLVNGWPQPNHGETFFEGVRDVLPAHSLSVSRDRIKTRRYWSFDPERRIRLGSFEEYAQEFRELFETAVRRRMRSTGPIAVTVSGGLDSSSIACLAARLHGSRPELPPVFGVHRSSPPGTVGYELDFVADVGKAAEIDIERIPFEVATRAGNEAWLSEMPDVEPFGPTIDRQADAIRARGARVLLVGMMGDELLGDTSYLVDLAWRLRWGTVRRHLREIPVWTEDAGGNYYGRLFRSEMARSFVRPQVLPILRRLKAVLTDPYESEPWWGEGLRDRGRRSPRVADAAATLRSESGRTLYRNVYGRRDLMMRQREDKIAAFYGFEEVSPYLDRDVLSFLVAIPGDVMSQDGVHRALLREAMREVLPPSISSRTWKGEYGPLFNAGVAACVREVASDVGDWEVVRRGYVVCEVVSRSLVDAIEDTGTKLHPIRRVIELENWLRAYFPSR